MHPLRPLCLIAAAGLLAPHGAAAQTAQATMEVRARVLPSCALAAGVLDFGAIERDAMGQQASAAVSLTCTPGTAYAVSLDDGGHGGRRMIDASNGASLDYDIFQDAAGMRRWNRDTPRTGVTPANGRAELVAYGRIVSTSATPGQYADLVTVTIAF